jgi:hypothetical protein
MPSKTASVRLAIALALTGVAAARAADYSGTYHGDMKGQPSSIDLSAGASGYAGTIHMGSTALPCQAADQGSQLSGTFAAGGASFPFTATLAGDTLTLSTGGATYTLTRPPANPLAAVAGGATATPPTPAATGDASELARTATGRTLVLRQPSATTASAALDATLPKLAGAVGGDVSVTGRFADTKQPDRGGASFTATVNGRSIRGVAFCGKSNDGGEDVSVAYAATDAPAAEWATLTAALPHQTVLHPYDFPDGTGTIGVPDGWTCKAQSACDPIIVEGPESQRVIFGQTIMVNGEQSPIVQIMASTERMRRENAERMRQMNAQVGLPPPREFAAPPPPASQGIFEGEFDDPVAMLQHVYPQLSEFLKARLGKTEQFDRLLATTPATAQLQGGKADLCSLLFTVTGPDATEHFHFQGRIEAAPVGTGATMLTWSGLQAHADTFDRDTPTMWAIAQSLKLNVQRLGEVGQQRCQQIADAGQRQMQIQNDQFQQNQRSMFERNQAFHDQQADQFDRFEQGINNQNLASHRASADFTEMIGGYQKVVNTRTGEERSVDYYNSNGIVAGLNEQAGDNTEWVAVHRRDEEYPLNH